MAMFKVIVEKSVTFRASVVTDAINEREAVKQVRQCINNEELKDINIDWEKSPCEEDSIKTYGEVYPIKGD